MSSFEEIDRCIRSELNDESLFAESKMIWGEISNRQMENAKDIDQFLKLLKRRGMYNAQEYVALRMFKKVIQNARFHDLVEKHQFLQQQHQQSSMCEKKNLFGKSS